ncbi:hypothetical protein FPQ18DRAFT_378972 [Pyronema domesticum]|nr:hypothetical protein FPQ18DRAFT_378972 [Pyronema domesticum]
MPNKKKKSSGKQKQSTQACGSSSNAPQESSTPSNTHSEIPTPNTTVPSQSSKTSAGRRFTCLRFPADGSPPGLVEGKMSTGPFSQKYGHEMAPDLSELWEGDCTRGQSIHPSLIPPLRGIVERFITGNWEDKSLERQVESEAYLDRSNRMNKAFKEILMSQMFSPEERGRIDKEMENNIEALAALFSLLAMRQSQ